MYHISCPALWRVTGGAAGALPPLAESSEAAPLEPPAPGTCCGLRWRLRRLGACAAAAAGSRGAAHLEAPLALPTEAALMGRTMGSTPLAAAAAAAAGERL